MENNEAQEMLSEVADESQELDAPASTERTMEEDIQSSADDAWDALQEALPKAWNKHAEEPQQWIDDNGNEIEGELEAEAEGGIEEDVDEEVEPEVDAEVDPESVEPATSADPNEALLFDSNGEAFELPEGAKIKVKVDGQEQLIDIQDFANGISGQKALSQRFSQIDQEKKQIEMYQHERHQLVGQMSDLISKDQVVQALELAFQSEGYDPGLAMTALFQQLTPYMERYAAMPANKRQEWASNLQNERQRLQMEAVQGYASKLQAEKDQLLQIRDLQQRHDLDDDSYMALHNALVQERQAGTMPGGNAVPTPNEVGEYVNILTREIWVKEALSEVNPEAAANINYVSTLAEQIRQLEAKGYEVDARLVREVAEQVYGQSAQVEKAKKVKKKLQKKGLVPESRSQQQTQARSANRNRHWMESFVDEIQSAGNDVNARQKTFDKWSRGHNKRGRI